jgi:DNA mismatch repair protein MutL
VELGEDAMFVDAAEGGLRCTGYVCRPDLARKAPQHVLVVNHRWVRHRGMTTAVLDGYGGLLPKGLYPAFALCLDVEPGSVDVNVHPSKREIRFDDESAVYRFVAEAVRSVLRQGASILEWEEESVAPIQLTSPGRDHGTNGAQPLLAADSPDTDLYVTEPLDLHNVQIGLPLTVTKEEKAAPNLGEHLETHQGVSVFQLHSAYIVAHVKDGMVLVDQSLAHRRILYEEAVVRFRDQPAAGQSLLFPITIDFGLTEIVALRDAIPLFERVGFGIRDFGGNSVVIDAIPVGLDGWTEGALFRAMVDDLLTVRVSTLALGDRSIQPLEHLVAVTYARHAALSHGTSLSHDEMRALIDSLFATAEPYTSPEGRPTLFRLSLQEIARRFV